jgi:hypothetical protein
MIKKTTRKKKPGASIPCMLKKEIMASLPREKSTLATIEQKDLYSNGSYQTDQEDFYIFYSIPSANR